MKVSGRRRACTSCGSELVHPWTNQYAGADLWIVVLRCPNCEELDTRVLDEEELEALDRALDADTCAIARDLDRMVQVNMAAELERLVAALTADAIQPMDF